MKVLHPLPQVAGVADVACCTIFDQGGAAMRADQKFFSLFNNNPITENVKRYINFAGFGGLLDFGYRNLDHGLLEALIERWRPETHTFHLPIGEATVILEDVNVLWGLPIEGGVVSGCEHPSSVANRILDVIPC
ncbi:hypothetical protein E3N88_21528 [Mikania micrantha]|uniref:Aminotransferase-like plant mobile domain-containing protein n=1 Tax=Mikania micrantha TaxID=192012 RepID=A0A5N6NMJ5_9ASTR|nr:hypothetical protein E3N88_21528 [Mikania micrantha]